MNFPWNVHGYCTEYSLPEFHGLAVENWGKYLYGEIITIPLCQKHGNQMDIHHGEFLYGDDDAISTFLLFWLP